MTKDTHQQLARNAMPIFDENKPLFSNEKLLEELQHEDAGRRQFARTVRYWLTRLADHRAIFAGVSHATAWGEIFDAQLFQADLQCRDTRGEIAHRVLIAVSTVTAIREVDESTEPTPIDLKVSAISIVIAARERANEIARADGECVPTYSLN